MFISYKIFQKQTQMVKLILAVMPVITLTQVNVHPESLVDIPKHATLVLDSPSTFTAVKLTNANVRLCLANTNIHTPLVLGSYCPIHKASRLACGRLIWSLNALKTLNSVCEGLVQ